LLPQTSGELLIDGIEMQRQNLEWQSTIGYVSQAIYLTDDTVRRNVAFGIAEADVDEVALERALKSAQLWISLRRCQIKRTRSLANVEFEFQVVSVSESELRVLYIMNPKCLCSTKLPAVSTLKLKLK
ncbi:multidrug resistance protein, partial [Acidimicrobiaceae bacterium]